MKKTLKTILILSAVVLLLSALAFSSSAVPAYHSDGKNGSCKSHTNKLVTLDDIADRAVSDNGGMRKLGKVTITKNIPLVIIVIGFDNIGYNDSYNWGNTIFQGESSLKQYYTDMSFGQFTFVPVQETSAYGRNDNSNKYDKLNDGIIHVTVDQKHDNWSLQQLDPVLNWNYSFTMTKAFVSAIGKANSYVDFSKYDDNKNGKIENNEMALGFIVAGYEAAYQTSYNTYSFWSHSFSISEAIDGYGFNALKVPVCDGVKVDSYIGIAEKLDTKTQEPICILAHELGHYLGLPDLYDTVYSTNLEWSGYDVDRLSVMCSGVWCEDEENGTYIPASFDAWSRYQLGWIKPTKITQNGVYELTSQNYDDITQKIKTVIIPTQNSGEYYLVENRQFNGWDRFLGNSYFDNGGVVIWHVDDNVYNKYIDDNQVNNTDHRPAVMPLYPETNNSVLSFIGNGSLLGRPFFNSANWAEDYAGTFGETLNLPLYATGKNADKRALRTLSGIGVGFPDDNGDSMNIFVDVDSHVHSPVYRNSSPGCIYCGYNPCYYCTYCRRYFNDKACTVEMAREDAVIAPTGHNYIFDKTVKPMADADGYDLYFCQNCSSQQKKNFKKLVGWGQDKDGKWYYAKSEGVFTTGWQTLKGRDGKTHKYYFRSTGEMITGLRSVNGKKYYFNSNGIMYSSRLISVNNKKYYLGKDGAAYSSRLISLDGKKYYLGSDCVAYKSRLASLDGKKYYFGSDCVMYKSRLASIDGKKYYFGSDGAAYKSKLISVDGKKYYIGKDCIAYKSKFASLDGKKYYFGSDCIMYKSKDFSVSGVKYRADSNGVCKKI
ncbi:MAG: M6 family metalloprotease domain-containing protein [Clostridiales bacterium]|nr:M6 family metalloprotease domain-containing protein [Clostridiales bacterium]